MMFVYAPDDTTYSCPRPSRCFRHAGPPHVTFLPTSVCALRNRCGESLGDDTICLRKDSGEPYASGTTHLLACWDRAQYSVRI